jgi:hypothetical protein
MKRLLLLALLATAAHAQFKLFSVTGGVELLVPPVFDLGQVPSGSLDAIQFRVRNVSSAPAQILSMALAGQGFLFSGVLALPQTLAPNASFDFGINFQANAGGSYSAGMTLPGISLILTATVVPALLYSAPSTIDFGPVVRRSTATLHVTISNSSTISLAIPQLAVHAQVFTLANAPPGGFVLAPQQSTGFDLQFLPPIDGVFSGTLSAGDRTFTLAGTGIDPSLPKPLLSVQLPQTSSGQQGSVVVAYDAASQVAGTGTLTLDFQGSSDPAVAFAAGGRTITFPVSLGDTQSAPVSFQTGTTAGALVFTVSLGSASDSRTVAIAPAAIALTAAEATRTTSSLTVRVTGFDNTRTAGPLAFTFYDRAGNAIAPAPIQTSADFSSYFQTSGLGGLFLLNAVFPVNGDPNQIGSFDVQMTNTAGVSKTARTSF